MGNCLIVRKGGTDIKLSSTGSVYHNEVQNKAQPAYTVTAEKDGIIIFFDRATGATGSPTITGATEKILYVDEKYADVMIFRVKKGDVVTISAVSMSGYGSRDCYLIYFN